MNENKQKSATELENNISLLKKLDIKEDEEKTLKAKKSFLMQHEKIFNVINNIYLLLNDENNNLNNDLSSNLVKLENIIDEAEEIEELKQINISVNQILIEAKEVTKVYSTLKA